MPFPHPLKVELDNPEPRVKLGRLSVPLDGTLWDTSQGEDWWIDPITRTLMSAPLPITEAWETNFSGHYARFGLSDYTVATPSNWIEVGRRAAADKYIEGISGDLVRTSALMLSNQPIFLSFYVGGVQSIGDKSVMVCGWGEENSENSVWLRFRGNGTVVVYKSGEIVGTYSLEGGLVDPGAIKNFGGSVAGKTVEVMLIPFRRTELLVVTNNGTGFSHRFTDLNFDLTTNVITPNDYFYWYVPNGRASVQMALCKFSSSATAYSVVNTLRYPPQVGQTFLFSWANDQIGNNSGISLYTGSIVKEDLSAFTPDGVIDNVRIKVTITTDNLTTVGFYAVDGYTNPTLTTTNDSPVDVTDLIHSLELSVDKEGRCSGTVGFFSPDSLEDEGLEKPLITGDRPIRIKIGDFPLLLGTATPPSLKKATGSGGTLGDYIEYGIVDRNKEFEDLTLTSSVPYDGVEIDDAIADLLKVSGYTSSDWSISASSFKLPYSPDVSLGNWKYLPERGDTVSKWLTYLHSTFCLNWKKGWRGQGTSYKYFFTDPADLPASSGITLYTSFDDARDACLNKYRAAHLVVRSEKISIIRPECNQVIVIGQDPATNRLITSSYNDAASQNPETLPGSRPDNWMGKVVTYHLIDPAITTQNSADRAVEVLVSRMTVQRTLNEIECDLLVRDSDSEGSDDCIWIGDIISVVDGEGNSETWRVIAIPRISLVKNFGSTNSSTWNCVYLCEK
jgi:hypothetical protein